MTEQKTLLQVRGLKKVFKKNRDEVRVLRGIDFDLHEGETVAITGSSGAGKSTFLHILGTLEPPTSGSVLFGQEKRDLFRLSERDLAEFRNRKLGFAFQFHYLLPEFDALENVMMPALIAGFSKSACEKQARSLLKFVGLSHRVGHRPTELSGGEQQRVAIARSVILKPKILMADELTGNLDSENGEVVLDLLHQLNQEMGVSILLVTHDLQLARKMGRHLIMKDGLL